MIQLRQVHRVAELHDIGDGQDGLVHVVLLQSLGDGIDVPDVQQDLAVGLDIADAVVFVLKDDGGVVLIGDDVGGQIDGGHVHLQVLGKGPGGQQPVDQSFGLLQILVGDLGQDLHVHVGVTGDNTHGGGDKAAVSAVRVGDQNGLDAGHHQAGALQVDLLDLAGGVLAGQGGSQGESHWLGAATGGDELFFQKLYVNVLCHNQRTPFSSLPSVGLFIVADLHSL